MASYNPRRLTFRIITAMGTLIAGVMYALAPTDDGKSHRVGAESSEAPVGRTPTSEPYEGGEKDAYSSGANEVDTLRREITLLREDLATVHRRIEQLTRRTDELEQQNAAHASLGPNSMLGIAPRESLATERQKLEAESEERLLAQAEANEAALQMETTDTAWSGEAYDLINSTVTTDELAGTSVRDVECRATLCRVKVTHKDPQARSVFEQQFIMAVAPLLPQAMIQTVENEDRSTSTIVYLVRDGHDFPPPESQNLHP